MEILIKISALLATFFFMEFMAWFTHRFVMHGFLWVLHKDHHQKKPGFFERNDAFFLIFAIPSFVLILTGTFAGGDVKLWIGLGILFYGIAYFMVHDILIHQRFRLFKKVLHPYLRAIRKAHKVHHKHLGPEEGECFGMLIVPMKYYREAKQVGKQK